MYDDAREAAGTLRRFLTGQREETLKKKRTTTNLSAVHVPNTLPQTQDLKSDRRGLYASPGGLSSLDMGSDMYGAVTSGSLA